MKKRGGEDEKRGGEDEKCGGKNRQRGKINVQILRHTEGCACMAFNCCWYMAFPFRLPANLCATVHDPPIPSFIHSKVCTP